MISVKYKGRLGNNMFQRATAELLAKSLKTTVYDYIQPGRGLNGHSFAAVHNLIDAKIHDTSPGEPDKTVKDFYSYTNYLKHLHWANYKNLHIRLDGYFQRSFIYLEHRSFLKSFYKLPPSNLEITPQDVIVCIRKGDIAGGPNDIPLKYYEHVIEKYYKNQPKWILTDSPRDISVRKLAKTYRIPPEKILGPAQGAATGISQLAQFTQVVGGIGSYYWWGIFLGSAERVFLPLYDGSWGCTDQLQMIHGKRKVSSQHIDLYLPWANYIPCSNI